MKPELLMMVGVLGGGAPLPIPLQFSGLELWLDLSYVVGLSNNDPISTIADRSGNGHSVTGVTTTRPLYKTNILNALPGALYDGTDDVLTTDLVMPAVSTAFVVYSGRAGVDGTFIGTDGLVPGQIQQNATIYQDAGVAPYAISRDLNAYNLLVMLHNWTTDNYESRANGVAVGSSTTASDVGTGTINIGQWGSGLRTLSGYIHEVLIYSVLLSPTDVQTIEEYLADKWGLTLG